MQYTKPLFLSFLLPAAMAITSFTATIAHANDYYDSRYPMCKLDKGAKLQKGVYLIESGTEEQACWLNNGLMPVVNNREYRDNSKYGFVNTQGKVTIPLTFEDVTGFNEGIAIVGKKTTDDSLSYGAINTKGQLVIPYQYQSLSGSSEGLISARNQTEKFGYIDANGKTVIDFQFDSADDFINGVAVVAINNPSGLGAKTGVINKAGKLVIPMIYDNIGDFQYNVAYFSKNQKYGLIGKDGSIILKPTYDEVSYMSKDLLAVAKNGKWGFIDHTGKLAIPLMYDDVGESVEDTGWDNGVISVIKDDKIYRINKYNKVISKR